MPDTVTQLGENLAALHKWGSLDVYQVRDSLEKARDKLGNDRTQVWQEACHVAIRIVEGGT